jgi:hypothetical protein
MQLLLLLQLHHSKLLAKLLQCRQLTLLVSDMVA